MNFFIISNYFPTTGIKIKAIVNEDVKTASKVTGRKNINSPAIPGQNINGKNAANVVDVDAITGIDICRADKTKTSFLLNLRWTFCLRIQQQ